MATVTDIAARAGVSPALVSRLLNSDPSLRISPDTQLRIMEAKRELGGLNQRRRRAVARKQSQTCVIYCPNREVLQELSAHMENRFFESLLKEFRQHGVQVSIGLQGWAGDEPGEANADLPDYGDAVLLVNSTVAAPLADRILAQRVPHVCADISAEYLKINTVAENGPIGIHQALRRLIELGHQNVGYVGRYHDNHYPFYVAEMVKLGLTIDKSNDCITLGSQIPARWTDWRAPAREAFGRWLTQNHTATALICHNDFGAMGVIDAMKDAGLHPGHDLSIVGYDNIEETGEQPVAEPMLTTIDSALGVCGRRAAEVLIQQLRTGMREIVHERIPVRFIERASIGPCRQK